MQASPSVLALLAFLAPIASTWRRSARAQLASMTAADEAFVVPAAARVFTAGRAATAQRRSHVLAMGSARGAVSALKATASAAIVLPVPSAARRRRKDKSG